MDSRWNLAQHRAAPELWIAPGLMVESPKRKHWMGARHPIPEIAGEEDDGNTETATQKRFGRGESARATALDPNARHAP